MRVTRLPVHLFLEALILGIILIGLLGLPLLVGTLYANRRRGPNNWISVGLTVAFLAHFVVIVVFVIGWWMRAFLHQDPFVWYVV